LDLVQKFMLSPPAYDDDKQAEDFIRRKSLARPRHAAYDDDSSGLDDMDEADFLFPPGGPTVHKSAALEDLKKKRRRRTKEGNDDDDGLTEEQRKERRKARHRANLEKLAKIKSELFVHDSDDASDEERDREFFEE